MVRTTKADNNQARLADKKPVSTELTEKYPNRFKKGVSGNPAGRKKGSKNKVNLEIEKLLKADAKKITRQVIAKAKKGDMGAIKMFLERVSPPMKDQPFQIELPELKSASDVTQYLATLAKETAKGNIPPTESEKLAKLADHYLKAVEVTDFEKRLLELEEKMN